MKKHFFIFKRLFLIILICFLSACMGTGSKTQGNTEIPWPESAPIFLLSKKIDISRGLIHFIHDIRYKLIKKIICSDAVD
jgi:hypothetical protein